MNSLDKAILDFLSKASKRIKADFLLNLSIVGLKLLLCLSFSLLMISVFITFPYVEEVIEIIIIFGLIITIIFGLIESPNKNKVALLVDSKGLNERVITSLGLVGCEDSVAIAQKKDTVKAIDNFNIKKNFKITIDKTQSLICLGLIAMCVLTSFVPSTAKKKAEEIRSFNKLQKELTLKLEKEKKDIEKAEGLKEEEKKDIEKIIDDAIKEINESENKREVNKTLDRLEKKIDDKKETISDEKGKEAIEESKKDILDDYNKEKQESAKKDLNTLANELIKNEESKALGEAILSGEENKINKEIGNIQKSIENMSSAELSKLSEVLKAASEDVSDAELSETLSNGSDSVLDKKLDGQKLSESISGVLNNSNGNNSGNSTSNNGENSEAESNEAQGNGQGQGGEGNGQGGRSQGGSGNGSGDGWDTGSTSGKENNIENKSGEEVFIPGRNEGSDGNLTGSKNEKGETQQIEIENGLNESGSKLNYDKVIGDYTNSALDGANNSNLPEGLKSLIKDYFEGLN